MGSPFSNFRLRHNGVRILVMALAGAQPVAAQNWNFSHDASGNTTTRGAAVAGLPQIVGQPQPQIVAVGDLATFSVVLADAVGATFQWRFNGADIGGATADSYVVPSVVSTNAGLYSVVVTNGSGSVTSADAALFLDTDGDGLPDTWEIANFGNLAQRATGDFDGDGISNVDEHRDGTNPASNAAYRPRLTIVTDGGGAVTMTPLKASYALGEVVTLTATGTAPNTFHGWSGALTSRINPETITMSANRTVKAHFIGVPVPTGVVSWWRGENDAVDAIGNNNGTLLNGVSFATGEVEQAFDFTAADQQVKMNASSSLNVGVSSGLTIETWIKPADLESRPIAEWHTGAGTGWGPHFWMNVSFSGQGGPGCLYTNLKDINGIDHYMFSPNGIVVANVWQHVAVTYDRAAGTTKLFRNGVVVATTTPGNFIPQTTLNFYLGHRPGTSIATYSGQMDEPALYNRALTVEEIYAINAAGPAGKDSTPYFTSPSQLPDGILATAYSQQLNAALGTAPLTYAAGGSGALPPGLSLSSAGLLTGSPTAGGTYSFDLRVTDAIGRSREQSFGLIVRAPMSPPAGIVSWWRLEPDVSGQAIDYVGGRHGSFFNSNTPASGSFATGKVGSAFQIPAPGLHIRIPDSAPLRQTQYTVEAWFYPVSNDSTYRGIFARGTPSGFADTWYLGFRNGSIDFFSEHTNASTHLLNSPAIALNQWTHVVGTFDGSTKALYVNGVRVAAALNLGPLVYVGSAPVTIGADWENAPVAYFNGSIDEVTLYDRALAAEEISNLFAAAAAGKTTSGPIINTPGPLSDGYVGQAYSKTFASLRTTGGTIWSVSGGTLPPGLTLNPAGLLSGSPTATGSYSFTLRLADGSPTFVEQPFTLVVYSQQPPTAGLISWWRGENNASDAIGSNHGTATNGATYAAGRVSQAFAFDGANDYINVPDSASLQPTSLTLEGWFNFTSAAGNPHLMAKPVGTSFHDSFVIWLNGGTLRAGVGDGAGGGNGVGIPFSPVLGQWYHIAFTFDNNAQRAALYLNGSPVGMVVAAGTVVYDNHPVLLGADIDSGNMLNFFNGRIDEATIYNRALSAAEIASVYNTGSAGKTVTGPYFNTADTLPEATLLSFYSQTVTTQRGTAPVTFSVVGGALPSGVTLDFGSGLLSGIPTAAGNFTVTLRATDASTLSADQTFTLQVLPLVAPPAGIVAWWRAQNDAQDFVGTNHGTLTNGATFAAGKVGNALSLDGVDDVVTVPTINAGSTYSVEFWLYPTRSANYEHLVSNNGNLSSYGDLYFRGDHIEYWQGGVLRLSSATGTIPLFAWSHVAMTLENGVNRLYINGELAAISVVHTETFNNAVAFGYTNSPSNNRFKAGSMRSRSTIALSVRRKSARSMVLDRPAKQRAAPISMCRRNCPMERSPSVTRRRLRRFAGRVR